MVHEDDSSRVWLLELEPGGVTEWHLHEYPYVFVVTKPERVRCEHVDGPESFNTTHWGLHR